MSPLPTLDDLSPLDGRAVLVRVDFNVPLADGSDGPEVADATRIEQALPTLRELIAARAKTILVSHCGRPKGEHRPEFSLRPAARALGELLGTEVAFAEDCVGEVAQGVVQSLAPGDVCLLENLRFHPGEEANEAAFAAQLASLAEIYVNDAFGTAHRAHASVVGAAERLAERAAGRLLVREVETLSRLLGETPRPYVGILGGAKISGKIDTLINLLPHLDTLLVGGGMANTFLAAGGAALGRSLVETDRLPVAREILAQASNTRTEILLPADLVVTDDLDTPGLVETVATDAVGPDQMAVDIGPLTRERFIASTKDAATLFWNGPLGVFEKPPFDAGTQAVAESLAECSGFTVIGGGETVAAVRRAGVSDRLSHVSTGGGASLELLAGKRLPGVAALEEIR